MKTTEQQESEPISKCTNRDCGKTHCARHSCHFNPLASGSDLNPANKFMCPNYVALFARRGRKIKKMYN